MGKSGKTIITCERCKQQFFLTTDGGGAKRRFCDECRKEIKKAKDRSYQQNYRKFYKQNTTK